MITYQHPQNSGAIGPVCVCVKWSPPKRTPYLKPMSENSLSQYATGLIQQPKFSLIGLELGKVWILL